MNNRYITVLTKVDLNCYNNNTTNNNAIKYLSYKPYELIIAHTIRREHFCSSFLTRYYMLYAIFDKTGIFKSLNNKTPLYLF